MSTTLTERSRGYREIRCAFEMCRNRISRVRGSSCHWIWVIAANRQRDALCSLISIPALEIVTSTHLRLKKTRYLRKSVQKQIKSHLLNEKKSFWNISTTKIGILRIFNTFLFSLAGFVCGMWNIWPMSTWNTVIRQNQWELARTMVLVEGCWRLMTNYMNASPSILRFYNRHETDFMVQYFT